MPQATSTASESSEVPGVPGLSGLLHGLNAGIAFSSFHDSVTGGATLFQPAIGYSFNQVFSLDITAPTYLYRLAESKDARPQPNAFLVPRRGEAGDLTFALHAQFIPRGFNYQATVSALNERTDSQDSDPSATYRLPAGLITLSSIPRARSSSCSFASSLPAA